MYKDSEISLDVLEKYYELVELSKIKLAPSSKLTDLIKYLNFFNNKYSDLNNDEKELIKNVLLIAKSIIINSSTYFNKMKPKILQCEELVQELESKQKGPIK